MARWFMGTSLAAAIENEDLPSLVTLMKETNNPNYMIRGQSVLHHAIRHNKAEAVAFLLQNGADTSKTDSSGWTPLYHATYRGNAPIVAQLLKAGADPNQRTKDGSTAYALAQSYARSEIVDLLKPYMKDIREEFGLPPLPGAEKKEAPAALPNGLPEGWVKLGDQQIARSIAHDQLGYRLTDVFDFHARERIRIVNNLATRADVVETRPFDSLSDKGLLEDALKNLQAQGGTADEASIHGGPRKAKLPPPQPA